MTGDVRHRSDRRHGCARRPSLGPRSACLGWSAFIQSGKSWTEGSRLSGAGRCSSAAQRGHHLQSTVVEMKKAVPQNGSCSNQATSATAIRRRARPWRQRRERAMATSRPRENVETVTRADSGAAAHTPCGVAHPYVSQRRSSPGACRPRRHRRVRSVLLGWPRLPLILLR